MKEYDRFERGAANGNKNTKILQRQLEDKDAKGNPHEYKIIVTTIQKLDNFITKNPKHPVLSKHLVLIFDECHRSQFGDMHIKIAKFFKNYHIFGFTGTPIFAKNAKSGGNPNLRTTEQAFGDKLHTYTIVDAINDGNVLPFRIDYINTVKKKDGGKDKQVEAINTDSALLAPERISEVVTYILDHFDHKTKRNTGFYTFSKLTNISAVAKNQDTKEEKQKVKLNGFNSIFAVSSIEAAKLYYMEFKRQMAEHPEKALKIATIYSYGQNEDDPDGFIDDEESDNTDGLDLTSREFLEAAIKDYNEMFNTAYDRAGPSATLEKDCEAEDDFDHIKRQPKDDYQRKLNNLLESACEQLRKKGYAEINSVVANPKTKYVLSEQESQKFNEIWKNSLGLFGAFHIGVIYQRRQEKEFWRSLDYATESNEILHQAPLRKLMQIVSIKSEVAESVDRLAYLYGIRDVLSANYINWYQQKMNPGIGICRNSDLNSPIPPEIYKDDLDLFLEPLIINLQSGP